MYNKFFKEKILAAALTLANGWKPARWSFLNPLTGIRSWGFYEGDDIRIELGSLNIGVQKVYFSVTGSGVDSSDFFYGPTDSVLYVSSTTSVSWSLNNDAKTEGIENALISVYADAARNQLLASAIAVIIDQSKNPITLQPIETLDGQEFWEGSTLFCGGLSGDTDAKITYYQWFKDDTPLLAPGNSGPAATSLKISLTGAGNYKVTVSVQYSDSTMKYLTSTPRLVSQVDNGLGVAGAIKSSLPGIFRSGVTLEASDVSGDPDGVSSQPSYTYQWYKNNRKIADATAKIYQVPDLESGLYKVSIGYRDLQGFSGIAVSPEVTVKCFVNYCPLNIKSSVNSFQENIEINAPIATLSTIDRNAGDAFVYRLVPGVGSEDNDDFQVIGQDIISKKKVDFETKRFYSIRVETTDLGGLSFEKKLNFAVVDVPELVSSIDSVLLPAEKDSIRLLGTANVSATGNNSANIITGNSGCNRIYGKQGADILMGGGGDDTFIYNSPTQSLLKAFDVITDFSLGDRLQARFLLSTSPLTQSVGQATSLDPSSVADVLTESVCSAASAFAFTVEGLGGTFVLCNNNEAGFQPRKDGIIHLLNYTVSVDHPVLFS